MFGTKAEPVPMKQPSATISQPDADISSDDTEVTTDRVRSLPGRGAYSPRRRVELSKTLTVPDTSGTYYYGVCVDAVEGETDIRNNCSQAIAITVTAPPLVPGSISSTCPTGA